MLIVLACIVMAALAWVVATTSATPRISTILSNRPDMADHLDVFQTAADWATPTCHRVKLDVSPTAARVVLDDHEARFPRLGNWTSAEVKPPRPFTELVPSYNPHCPPDTGLRFDVRTRDARSGNWSGWFYLGAWGRTLGKEARSTENDFGRVNIDYLVLARPADAYQVRVRFYAFNLDEKSNPAIRRLTVCTSGPDAEAARRQRDVPTIAARDLPVPFRAQDLAAKPLRSEICSPTSVSMVMQYLGHDRATEDNALAIYDDEYDLFGNWARATAWAAENGFDAWLTRFRSFNQVKATIAAGQPIIASIRFKEGECPSFVMKKTAGHLIVIRGVTPAGDYIVNDPASKDRGRGAIYKADDIAKAWFAHGGVGYVIRKPGT